MAAVPIIPFALWLSGTNQNSTPANDNSLRHEILNGLVISKITTAQPASPADGDIYIIPAGATGAQWSLLDPDDLTIFKGGSWYAFAPVSGVVVNFDGSQEQFAEGSAGWQALSGGGGGGGTWGSITGTLSDQADLQSALDAKASITYVDGLVQGLSWKKAVRAATTANGTLATAYENGDAIDGVTLATGDRILLKNQTTATENGIYTVNASGAPTRATDADTGAELVNATVYVSEGTTLSDTQWTQTANAPITIGSTSLAFAQLSAGGGGGGLTNFTESANSAAPNATVPVVQLLANNAATNVDVAISVKGTGALIAQVPTATAVGGNKRGQNAVDFQVTRSAAAQVAGGPRCFIGSGEGNSISGFSNSSIVGGLNNTISHSSAVIGGGQLNTVSAEWGAVLGGRENTASGRYSFIPGGFKATTRGLYGVGARASGMFGVDGDAQVMEAVYRRQTTSATPAEVSAGGLAPDTETGMVVPNNSCSAFSCRVVARQGSTGNSAAFLITGAIKRGANAASTTLLGTPTVTVLGADAGASGWTVAATANTTLGSLGLTVTGAAASTINWVASIDVTQVAT